MIEVQAIQFGSPEWEQALKLRYEVLRKPLGLEYSEADLELEKKDYHFAAFDGENLIGFFLLKPISNSIIKMRQVAVAPERQGQGVGKKLVLAAEEFARTHKYKKIYLDARESAVKFYESLFYQKEGDPFIAATLPHWRMWKSI